MNNKSVLAMSFLVFNFSLFALADDAPTEVVITGTQNTSNTTSTQQQTTIQIPESSGNNQYSSAGYAKAMAEKAAAEEKGRRLQACYQQLASLDKSKYACSEDGELIDVVEVTGVKAGDNSAPSLVNEGYYNEMDNTRPPAPPCDSLATIEEKQAQCKVDLGDAFKQASENCGAFGGTSAALAIAAGAVGAESKNKWVKGVAYSIAGLAALSTELFGTSCPSSTQLDLSKDECDLRAAQHKQGCGY